MKAWQLTLGLAVLAILAGQLPQIVVTDDAPPVRARLDRVVGTVEHGLVGPEERPSVDRVDEIIYANPDVGGCLFDAHRELGRLPDLMVQFHVGPTGIVDDARLTVPAQLQHSTLDHCLSRALEALRFAPVGGTGVWFHYPFKF